MVKRPSAHDRLQQRRLIDRAVAQLRQGQLAPAEADLQAVLLRWPGQGDALHFLGLLRHQQGQGAAALGLLRRAVQALPGEPGPLNNLGYRASSSSQFTTSYLQMDSWMLVDTAPRPRPKTMNPKANTNTSVKARRKG